MNIALLIFSKVFPLYLNVLLGIIASVFNFVDRRSIASLLVYLIGPIVVFNACLTVHIDKSLVIMPILLYFISSFIAFFVLFFLKKYFNDNTINILSFTSGTGNTGYFGIPLAIILFNENVANAYIFTVISSLLYESTTGFYVTAKGKFSPKESFLKVLKLPLVYAFLIGIILNLLNVKVYDWIIEYSSYFKSTYGLLGMMMLGMGLTGTTPSSLVDMKLISFSFFFKFLVWPLIVAGMIFLDSHVMQLIKSEYYPVLALFSVVPLAGNTITLAVLVGLNPSKASLTVFLSTVFSIPYIPVVLSIFSAIFGFRF